MNTITEELLNAMISELFDKDINEGYYVVFPSTQEASDNVEKLYWNKAEFSDIRFELDEAITLEGSEKERQGFVNGFRKAIEMLNVAD